MRAHACQLCVPTLHIEIVFGGIEENFLYFHMVFYYTLTYYLGVVVVYYSCTCLQKKKKILSYTEGKLVEST